MQKSQEPVNRGAGYGLEVPCVYRLCGPMIVYVDKMKELVESLLADGHIICIITLLNGLKVFFNGRGRWR